MRNMLVGYDGSEAAVHALTFAADLARAFGASMHILAVVRRGCAFRRNAYPDREKGLEQRRQRLIGRAAHRLKCRRRGKQLIYGA
jgi:nucleotide-binding universal stress UspA family protein